MRKSFFFSLLLLAIIPAAAQTQNVVGATPVAYILRPGDVLKIIVWGQPTYSGQFKIDETGRFQYPVLGEIDTSDKPLRQIRDEL